MSPNLTQLISANVPTMDGWCSVEKALALANAIIGLPRELSAVTVEIGVFGGRSLIPMALAHADMQHGIVWGIDPWQPKESIIGQDEANAQWWGACDHDRIRNNFLGHVTRLGLAKYINVIRARSDDVEPPPVIGILHSDGNHGPQAIRDVERFASHVAVGGFCFLDDLHWEGGNVERAEAKLLAMGFRKTRPIDTGAIFQRVAEPKKKKAKK